MHPIHEELETQLDVFIDEMNEDNKELEAIQSALQVVNLQ